MKSVVIGVPVLVAAWAGLCEPASATPGAPPHEVNAAAQSQLRSPVRHYSQHRRSQQPNSVERNAATPEPAAPGGVKPGLWEFAAQLQTTATSPALGMSQSPTEKRVQIGGASKTAYTNCITSNEIVPTAFGSQCSIDDVQRNGGKITWSMTCTNPQNSVRSEGVAQYRGDTMQGTVISHLPGTGGRMTDVTQRVTGRYLGPCTQVADGPPPSGPDAPAWRDSALWVEPPAAPGNAMASAPTAEARSASAGESAVTAGPKRSSAQPRRYAEHRRPAYHRYSGGGWPWGRGFLPIPLLGGLF